MQTQHDKINKIVENLRLQFADDPNVRSIGWTNIKIDDTDELCINFYINLPSSLQKSSRDQSLANIPDVVEGFPTRMIPMNPKKIAAGQRDDNQYDPLIGGVASSNAEGHIYWFNEGGTLGILVRNNSDNAAMALSNWHVWADGGEEGDTIIQPGHPTAGGHIEAIGKVAACGPLITSLIEWEVPSPLALGLYGGAAAAAIAAAASDYRDPTRRGQDHTPVPGTELTHAEEVDVSIEYPDLPITGIPFRTDTIWNYVRHTDQGSYTYQVEEQRVNTQFLLGQMVITNRSSYRPGEMVQLIGAIWDYQPRPCDAYHVVAHMIPHHDQNRALRTVMQPMPCPRYIPLDPPEEDIEIPDEPGVEKCGNFNIFKLDTTFPQKGTFFQWLHYVNQAPNAPTIIRKPSVNNADPFEMLWIPQDGMSFSHNPASKVRLTILLHNSTTFLIEAFSPDGQVIAQRNFNGPQGELLEVNLEASEGQSISVVTLRGGASEAYLAEYCITPAEPSSLTKSCIRFNSYQTGQEFPYKGRFRWLQYLSPNQQNLRIVNWLGEGQNALYIPAPSGLRFSHVPGKTVTVKVASFTSQPITIVAFGQGNQILDRAVSPSSNGEIFELTVRGDAILGTAVTGGGGEGLLLEYCVETLTQSSNITAKIPEHLIEGIRKELPKLKISQEGEVEVHRCCFQGKIRLPPWEKPGKWDVYLTVQNVNHVPDGTPPDEAATIIGGHVLSPNADVLACTGIMLLDHVFDVI